MSAVDPRWPAPAAVATPSADKLRALGLSTPAILRGQALTPAQERARQHWKVRALMATKANQSLLGMIVCAMLGRAPDHPPRICSGAYVDRASEVWTFYQPKGAAAHSQPEQYHVGSLQEIKDNMNRLADAIQASDAERVEMFAELRAWISHDERAESGDLFG